MIKVLFSYVWSSRSRGKKKSSNGDFLYPVNNIFIATDIWHSSYFIWSVSRFGTAAVRHQPNLTNPSLPQNSNWIMNCLSLRGFEWAIIMSFLTLPYLLQLHLLPLVWDFSVCLYLSRSLQAPLCKFLCWYLLLTLKCAIPPVSVAS